MATVEEVVRLQRQLVKAQDDEDWGRMVDVLGSLEATEVTLATLEASRVGATVSKHRKHSDARVADAAKALVKKWKQLAAAAGVEAGAKTTTAKPSQKTASSSASSSQAPPRKREDETTKKTTTTNGSNNGSRPLSFASSLPSEFRESSRKRLLDALGAPDASSYELAESIEGAMAALFPNHASDATAKREYVAKLRQLVFNVKKNEDLREGLRAGEIDARKLVSMSVEELAPKALQEERQRMREFQHDARSLDWDKRNRDRLMKAIGIDESKGMFQCGKCKSKRISNHAKQTRSADEPMTQFFECADCGNRWRF